MWKEILVRDDLLTQLDHRDMDLPPTSCCRKRCLVTTCESHICLHRTLGGFIGEHQHARVARASNVPTDSTIPLFLY